MNDKIIDLDKERRNKYVKLMNAIGDAMGNIVAEESNKWMDREIERMRKELEAKGIYILEHYRNERQNNKS